MHGIFISYRKEDSKAWAINLQDRLVRTFGKRQIFRDVDCIEPGEWRAQIYEALRRCRVVLVLIGQRWASARDGQGRERLFLTDDVHRVEIANALATKHITVIPVLLDGAPIPFKDHLPEDIQPLLERQFREIGDPSVRRFAEMDSLVRELEHITGLRRQKLMAVTTFVSAIAIAVANTLVPERSILLAGIFLALASCIFIVASKVIIELHRQRFKHLWLAVAAASVSGALIVGSLVRLHFFIYGA